MTDTVNVPRGALEKAVAVIQHLDPSLQDVGEASFRALVGSLAATPKADGMDAYTRPDTVDAIKAPKVEQEPVAWRYRFVTSTDGKDLSDWFIVDEPSSIPAREQQTVEPLYTHPAPASDELLEAAINLRAAQRVYMADRGNEMKGKAVGAAADRLDQAIAKHKGPQS